MDRHSISVSKAFKIRGEDFSLGISYDKDNTVMFSFKASVDLKKAILASVKSYSESKQDGKTNLVHCHIFQVPVFECEVPPSYRVKSRCAECILNVV